MGFDPEYTQILSPAQTLPKCTEKATGSVNAGLANPVKCLRTE